jgi:hypothetical protein
VKIIRTLAACALAGSAVVGTGFGVAAVATASAAPTAVAASGSVAVCPNAEIWDLGKCVPAPLG